MSTMRLDLNIAAERADGSRKGFRWWRRDLLPSRKPELSRELLYTALTRSRQQLVLLIEGNDATTLFDLTRPEKSETARRNTNLFQGCA